MYLDISADTGVTLRDIEDFSRFHVETNLESPTDSAAFRALAAQAEDDHYWLGADAIIALSDKSDQPDWISRFKEMLSNVEKYGFFDRATDRVKLHVVRKP